MMLRLIGVFAFFLLLLGSTQNACAQSLDESNGLDTPLAQPSSLTDQDLPKMFTKREIQIHLARINILTHVSAQCLTQTFRDHVQFFQKWHVSKYYGDRRKENATETSRIAELKKYGAPASLVTELQPISCIGLTMKCLEEGFSAAGQELTWEKIYAQLSYRNNFYGTDLQKMLGQLGWTGLYWNPDPLQNAQWDIEDRKLIPAANGKFSPAWGDHVTLYREVVQKHKYAGIPVANSKALVGFRTHVPALLRAVPFYVGTAHSGYHVFPGFNGSVIEGHSTRPLNSIANLEVSEFNPMSGGGPKWTENMRYRSGVVMVPPKAHREKAKFQVENNEGGISELSRRR